MSTAAGSQPARGHLERFGVWYILLAFALSRIFVVLVALSAPLDHERLPKRAWWSPVPLMRWDAGHYRQTMVAGYPDHVTEQVAFFPGQSIAAWPIWQITKQFLPPEYAPDVAIVATSHLFALIGVLLFYHWGRACVGAAPALAAVVLFFCYPPAFFLSTGYAEGLFLACVAGVLVCMQSRRYAIAALLCAVATLTRPPGVALAMMLLCAMLLDAPVGASWLMRLRAVVDVRRLARAALLGLIGISGLVGYMVFLRAHYGHWSAYAQTNTFWQTQTPPNALRKALTLRPIIAPAMHPLSAMQHGDWAALAEPFTWNGMFNLAFVSVMVIGLTGIGQRDRAATVRGASQPPVAGGVPRLAFLFPFLQFLIAYLSDPVGGARLVGIARYHLVALPCFVLLALWLTGRDRRVWPLVLVCVPLVALQVVYIQEFCDWILVS